MKGLGATLLVITMAAVALYAAVLALLWWQQEALLFHPQPLPKDYRLATEPDVHEERVQVPGASLSVLHLRLPDPKGVVFFLHGNAGNLAGWFTDTAFYRQAGYDLVMPDYRGYGKSTGRIAGPQQLRDDVRAVWDNVAPRYAGRRIVLFGRSLGTGLAADLAEQLTREGRPPDLTVLVSPYSSLRELTAEFYPWVPGGLLRYPLDTGRHLPNLRGRVLLVHGGEDSLIGVHHSERLLRVLPSAQLLVIPGAGHNDLHLFPRYREALREALLALSAEPPHR
ncbi:alpha/beta fold hydrolase [Ramlibacter henchirensis]|uniref:Alpha/beta fold hydrolase n=1 Tax=Ramlibacter henchirensis TaxID=204072 RepID=A0A4Z0C3J1_9BURK|nr:alpha/beta fold hydrolase [Ramlibacter henchirensis]TFZ06247.1 alpha/beta fold hydrolase [Ramlibacter henchirensis]